jgi:hypothetical protein
MRSICNAKTMVDIACAGQHALDQYDDRCLIINDQDFS